MDAAGELLQLQLVVGLAIQSAASWLVTRFHNSHYTQEQKQSQEGRQRYQLHFRLTCVLLLLVYAAYTEQNFLNSRPRNAYHTLQLPVHATAAEVKTMFRKMSLQYHPDRGGSADLYARFQTDYTILSSVTMRQVYDYLGVNAFAKCPSGCSTYREYFMASATDAVVGYGILGAFLVGLNWLNGQAHMRQWILVWIAGLVVIDLQASVCSYDALWFIDWLHDGLTVREKIEWLGHLTPVVMIIIAHLHEAFLPHDSITVEAALVHLRKMLDDERIKFHALGGLPLASPQALAQAQQPSPQEHQQQDQPQPQQQEPNRKDAEKLKKSK